MTPLTLATDPHRSIEFLRDVVGYGLLPGENSDVASIEHFSTTLRAAVLAWYWPQPGYDGSFDPIDEFQAASRANGSERDLHVQVRALVGNRVASFLALAGTPDGRTMDEAFAAACWRTTCSGEQLLGVIEGTHGLDLLQIMKFTEALGLRYIDPLDDTAAPASWTTAAEEVHRNVMSSVRSVVDLALAVARKALVHRLERSLPTHDDNAEGRDTSHEKFDETAETFRGLLPRLEDEFHRRPETVILEDARTAFRKQEDPTDAARTGRLIAELTVGHDADNLDRTADLLAELFAELGSDSERLLKETIGWAADRVADLPDGLEEINQGYGWLLMERARVSRQIDRAIADIDSIAAARATIRKALNTPEGRPTAPRPGDTYAAPKVGTRYRALYEALATTDASVPLLRIDPDTHQIQTSTRGWIDLPTGAVRDSTWWSGSGQSSSGRPQVRAWRAAGYDTPRLTTNEDDVIVSAQFPALPGRENWLEAHDEHDRLAQGRYTVPPAPDTPLHAVFSYSGPPVWHMHEEQFDKLRVSINRSTPSSSSPRSAADRSEPNDDNVATDDDRIERLVAHLRAAGETDRRGIESFFAAGDHRLSEGLEIAKWLPNLLAKASRRKRIANIGTRKQPRWVAAGTAAHLAGRLARALEHDSDGERVAKVAAPRLAPGEAVPPDLYVAVVRHAFPEISPGPARPRAPMLGKEMGEAFLTDEAMKAVLAGRRLTEKGIEALLHRIDLEREAGWEAAASAASAFDGELDDLMVDDDEILAAQ
ncbi:hypothetical protein [Isoptericola rhizosphaerae]|uniref:hypothetical protein n=1 Tax=Isoptericola rhizosphaerae TaxID=3377837 RepID=UPI00383BC598